MKALIAILISLSLISFDSKAKEVEEEFVIVSSVKSFTCHVMDMGTTQLKDARGKCSRDFKQIEGENGYNPRRSHLGSVINVYRGRALSSDVWVTYEVKDD